MQTRKLMRTLREGAQVERVLQENGQEFIAQPLPQALAQLLEENGVTRAQAIHDAMLNNIYGYQIFSGARTPSRDKLLALAFGMRLSYEQTDTLLKTQGYARLYARRRRDAVIIHGLMHQTPLLEVNTRLYENGWDTLS
ncbi:MAG: hypothetical protein HDT27_07960 [Subdoligranulum sp.]|nr:hypothetical protein [Subdoligranulum sp.]MBD5102609.1 hypothetical protein [Subdoligranulum sp.]